MKVLVVSPYYYPAVCYGGPVWVLRDLARGLADQSIDVQVITTSANGSEESPPRTERVDGIEVRYERRWNLSRWFFSPASSRAISRAISSCDILYVHGLWVWTTASACAVARRHRKPYVIVPHGTLEPWALAYKGFKKQLYLSLIEKRNLRYAAAVHCLTEREKAHVLKKAPDARCEVIPNAVNLLPEELTEEDRFAFRAKFSSINGKRIVLFLSRIHAIKGLDRLIPAFARIRNVMPDTHLLIAGPDEEGYLAVVERMIVENKITDDVTFTGLLNRKEKMAAFDAASVFVLPSYSEGLPVVVLEAMSLGKPVVITPECNLDEEILSAGAGVVVGATVESLAAGIESVLSDRERATQMGLAARALATERYSLDVVTRSLIELFEEIVRQAEAKT